VSWDIALDPDTGDFMFSPTRDLIGVSGPQLDTQRIIIRAKIPRGTFMYDSDGTLGSNLHLVSRNPSPTQVADAKTYLLEALDDADGISVQSIDMEVTDNQLIARVKFIPTESLDLDDTDFENQEDRPEFDANVMLGHLE